MKLLGSKLSKTEKETQFCLYPEKIIDYFFLNGVSNPSISKAQLH
jgi:hypothetical protein